MDDPRIQFELNLILIRELLESKHRSLAHYATKPEAKQSYLDRQNKEIEILHEFATSADEFIKHLLKVVEYYEQEFEQTRDAQAMIRKLRRELKKAEIYINSKGLGSDWRWIIPEIDGR